VRSRSPANVRDPDADLDRQRTRRRLAHRNALTPFTSLVSHVFSPTSSRSICPTSATGPQKPRNRAASNTSRAHGRAHAAWSGLVPLLAIPVALRKL
jgi:hypothetical protein